MALSFIYDLSDQLLFKWQQLKPDFKVLQPVNSVCIRTSSFPQVKQTWTIIITIFKRQFTAIWHISLYRWVRQNKTLISTLTNCRWLLKAKNLHWEQIMSLLISYLGRSTENLTQFQNWKTCNNLHTLIKTSLNQTLVVP